MCPCSRAVNSGRKWLSITMCRNLWAPKLANAQQLSIGKMPNNRCYLPSKNLSLMSWLCSERKQKLTCPLSQVTYLLLMLVTRQVEGFPTTNGNLLCVLHLSTLKTVPNKTMEKKGTDHSFEQHTLFIAYYFLCRLGLPGVTRLACVAPLNLASSHKAWSALIVLTIFRALARSIMLAATSTEFGELQVGQPAMFATRNKRGDLNW